MALDADLDREVALKEIQARHADHPESRARFLTEARVTGALEHPGIVPVYGLGVYSDGRPYYAMRFIKGDSLKDAIEAFHAPDRMGASGSVRSLELRQLLGRFVDVCNAITYAHSRGVIHRDLKPANVMLGKFGETLVVDWGLAKVVGQADVEATTASVLVSSGDSALTQAGQALGTPAFMSPEQAAGRLDRVGPASDTYSLGATLYCLLTGKTPFTDKDVGVVLAKVEKGDFKPPRQVNASLPPPLQAVCLKAMALKPQDRYSSPRELAEEIEHWLADEPVSAYREPLRVRAGRWARRHPAVVAGTAALVFTALLGVTIGGLLLGREQQAKLQQQRKAREAQVATLLDVAPQAVPAVLEALEPYRDEIRPLLQESARKPEPREASVESIRLWRQHRARAALGLLAEDPGQAALLTARLFEEGLDPAEMILVRDALKPHAAELKADLWRRAKDDDPAGQFRALVALAAFDPDSPRWRSAARSALVEMLKADPLHLGQWVDALRPVKQHLLPSLERVFRGEDEPLKEYRQVAASVLADYAADRAETLAELLFDADARQYAVIKPALMKHREEAIARMRKELAARPDYWKDPPLDPKGKAAPDELVREIEQAGGIVAERFALCQALPLERVLAVTDGLRQSGYRPVRVRPWNPSPPAPLPEAERGEKGNPSPPGPPPRSGEGGERQPLPPGPPSPKRREGGRKATPPPQPPSPKRRGGSRIQARSATKGTLLPHTASGRGPGGGVHRFLPLSASGGEGWGGGVLSPAPPLRFGEGVGGRGSSPAPPLRFGEGAGGGVLLRLPLSASGRGPGGGGVRRRPLSALGRGPGGGVFSSPSSGPGTPSTGRCEPTSPPRRCGTPPLA